MRINVPMLALSLQASGIVALAIEFHFYEFVDVQGVLHESLLLPLGSLTLVLGSLIWLTYILQWIWHRFKS